MLYKVVLFTVLFTVLSCAVVLFTMLFKVVLAFEYGNEIRKCDHWSEKH